MTETSVAPELVVPELVMNAFAPGPALIAGLESKSAITSPKTRWRISIHSLTVVDGWVNAERSPATPSSNPLFSCPQTWAVRPMQTHKRERVFLPLPFHDLLGNSSIGSDPFEESRG